MIKKGIDVTKHIPKGLKVGMKPPQIEGNICRWENQLVL